MPGRMKLVILSRKRSLYSTRRLVEEAKKLELDVRVIDPLRIVIGLVDGKPSLLYRGRSLEDTDVVLVRLGLYAVPFCVAVIRQFRLLGIPTVNDDEGICRARNKLRCLQHLVENKVPVPDTLIARMPVEFPRMLKMVGGAPVILKLLAGMHGTGVMLSESPGAALASLEAVWSLGYDIMMQRFIRESRGRDIRAIVIGGKVQAAMRRRADEKEFRSNIKRGGVGEPVRLTKEYRRVAEAAAAAIGLQVSGVDMLESERGPLVIEVNASPGFQGLEAATGENVARRIVLHAARQARRSRLAEVQPA